MKRTNIFIDEALVERVMRRYRLRTKTEAVALALRRLAGEPMSAREALAMRGARSMGEVPPAQPPPGLV